MHRPAPESDTLTEGPPCRKDMFSGSHSQGQERSPLGGTGRPGGSARGCRTEPGSSVYRPDSPGATSHLPVPGSELAPLSKPLRAAADSWKPSAWEPRTDRPAARGCTAVCAGATGAWPAPRLHPARGGCAAVRPGRLHATVEAVRGRREFHATAPEEGPLSKEPQRGAAPFVA